MAKEVASPKQTGGGGYSFEDQVAAFFLLHILSGEELLGASVGRIERIDFQNRAAGWRLDDLLIGFSAGPRLALSVKSDQQLTSNGFPEDFVISVWEQWLQTGASGFDSAVDYLGLVTGPLPHNVEQAWNTLESYAKTADPDNFPADLAKPKYTNKIVRDLFASLHCPASVDSSSARDPAQTARLVQRLRVLPFDYERSTSRDLREAVEIGRRVLESGVSDESETLIERLKGIARQNAPTGGFVDRTKLLSDLRDDFCLKDSPGFAADWSRVESYVNSLLSGISEEIAGGVRIDRDDDVKESLSMIDRQRGVIFLGPSGHGKTVLAKKIANSPDFVQRLLWLDAVSLERPTLADVTSLLGLHYSVAQLVQDTATHRGLIVLDGLESFSDSAIRNAALLLMAASVFDDSSPWRVLCTCQPEDYERVAICFSQNGIAPTRFKVESVKPIGRQALDAVCNEIPNLAYLKLRSDLAPMLANLKVLDVVASAARLDTDPDAASWVGESDVVTWFWHHVIESSEDGLAKSRLLQRLAEREADQLASSTPLIELSDQEAKTLSALRQDKHCRVRDEGVTMSHDLLGDWARQRLLLSHSRSLIEYLSGRVTSPRWIKALRLYGVCLLEQHTDIARWQGVLQELRSSSAIPNFAADVLLESVVLASNPEPILERLRPVLMEDGGALLSRLLGRFLHTATLPNPLMLAIADQEESGSDIYAATWHRIPYWPFWLPMLRFLHRHRDELVPLVPSALSKITDIWLRQGETSWPYRAEASEIAITIADWVESEKKERKYFPDVKKEAYRALLASVTDRPDDVCRTALALAQRVDVEHSEEVTEEDSPLDDPHAGSPLADHLFGGPLSDPWPDGPKRRVDHDFQEVCLESDALAPLFTERPEVAIEVLLALLIKHPVPQNARYYYNDLLDDLETESISAFRPAIYFRGPFYRFLQVAPEFGIDLILRFVNFATQRWCDSAERRGHERSEVTIPLEEGDVVWAGNRNVFLWYRDRLVDAHAVPCALMALEKWLYDLVDAEQPIDHWLNRIFTTSRSVAFAGVLTSLGLRHPELVRGPLRPLLATWQFHEWELHRQIEDVPQVQFHLNLMLIQWTRCGKSIWELARDWYTLEHRKQYLHEVSQRLFVSSSDIRDFFANVRNRWGDELGQLQERGVDSPYLDQLIAIYDPDNWSLRQSDEGVLVQFEAPQELREKRAEETERNDREREMLHFPVECRMALDDPTRLENTDVESFWERLQGIASYEGVVTEDQWQIQLKDSLSGGIAVLIIYYRDWLREDPSREKWCFQRLNNLLDNPPPAREFDSDVSIYAMSWQSFFAELMPTLWAETPGAPGLRSWIAVFATDYHYVTAGVILSRSYSVRDQLGDEFSRLVNLTALWASLRNVFNCTQYLKHYTFDLNLWRGRLIDAFTIANIPVHELPWQRICDAADRRIEKRRIRNARALDDENLGGITMHSRALHRRWLRRGPGMDVHVLQHGFGWIPRLAEARDDDERKQWIGLVENMLSITLRMLEGEREVSNDEEDADGEISGMPYDYDRWVFRIVATLLPQMRTDETPTRLWKPVIDLGTDAHYWVEDFLSSWLCEGSQDAANHDAFVRVWREMVEHVFTSGTWDRDTRHAWKSRDDLYHHLLGMDWSMELVTTEGFRPVIASLAPYYQQWAERRLSHVDSAIAFARFLHKPAAADLVDIGLPLLRDALAQYGEYEWRRDRLASSVCELLVTLYEDGRLRKLSVRSNDCYEATIGLLAILADRQHAPSLALQDRLAKGI